MAVSKAQICLLVLLLLVFLQQLFSYFATHSKGGSMVPLGLYKFLLYDTDFERETELDFLSDGEKNAKPVHPATFDRNIQPIVSEGTSPPIRPNSSFAFTLASSFDCMPEGKYDIVTCQSRGCVWSADRGSSRLKCSFKTTAPAGYRIKEAGTEAAFQAGAVITLTANAAARRARPNVHEEITVQAEEHSNEALRITFTGTKTTDPASLEGVPLQYARFSERMKIPKPTAPKFTYRLIRHPVTSLASVQIKRAGSDIVLFETNIGPLLFANQFREITTTVPTRDVYGMGEHSRDTFRHSFDDKSWGMFARDQPTGDGRNLYGDHPYVQIVDDPVNGRAYGMLLLNAHAKETVFSKPSASTQAITYRTLGGNLDFYFIVGENPGEVNRRYMSLIGKPYLPPFWALGFQISRFGYMTFENMRSAVERTLRARIPLDVFYGDIDYFDSELGFTISDRFKELPAYVEEKLKTGLRFATVQDPCVAALPSHGSFARALEKKNVFIRWPVGYVDRNNQSYDSVDRTAQNYLLGHVWPGAKVVYVDYFHQDGQEWWKNEVKILHKKLKFSALWNDMNEPTNFATNRYHVWYKYSPVWPWSLDCPNSTSDYLDMPPYIPKSVVTLSGRISDKTICMASQQRFRLPGGEEKVYNHYDVHNLYGHSQIQPSFEAMHAVMPNKERSYVIGRSTFVGSGAMSGHWLGDNYSNWTHLRQSVIGIMDFNLFGIPYVGADVCGFFLDTNPQLCLRWMQLGAFYPFFRNHNGKFNQDQDPGVFPRETNVTEYSKHAVDRRYTLLPYLYTLFSQSAEHGNTVVRSLMEVFTRDPVARGVYTQFMWGDALLITPVLEKDVLNVTAYFPEGVWYDWETSEPIESRVGTVNASDDGYRLLPVTLKTIPLHIRGGYAIPTQGTGKNTAESSLTPYAIRIAPDRLTAPQRAKGYLFWDGGLLQRDKQPNEDNEDFRMEIEYEFDVYTAGNATGHMGKVTLRIFNKNKLKIAALDGIQISGYPDVAAHPLTDHLVITRNGAYERSKGAIHVDNRQVLRISGLNLTLDDSYTSHHVVTIEFFNSARPGRL